SGNFHSKHSNHRWRLLLEKEMNKDLRDIMEKRILGPVILPIPKCKTCSSSGNDMMLDSDVSWVPAPILDIVMVSLALSNPLVEIGTRDEFIQPRMRSPAEFISLIGLRTLSYTELASIQSSPGTTLTKAFHVRHTSPRSLRRLAFSLIPSWLLSVSIARRRARRIISSQSSLGSDIGECFRELKTREPRSSLVEVDAKVRDRVEVEVGFWVHQASWDSNQCTRLALYHGRAARRNPSKPLATPISPGTVWTFLEIGDLHMVAFYNTLKTGTCRNHHGAHWMELRNSGRRCDARLPDQTFFSFSRTQLQDKPIFRRASQIPRFYNTLIIVDRPSFSQRDLSNPRDLLTPLSKVLRIPNPHSLQKRK
ncbi:3931_t:CDS:2, partial [Acaulospora colombiana]